MVVHILQRDIVGVFAGDCACLTARVPLGALPVDLPVVHIVANVPNPIVNQQFIAAQRFQKVCTGRGCGIVAGASCVGGGCL